MCWKRPLGLFLGSRGPWVARLLSLGTTPRTKGSGCSWGRWVLPEKNLMFLVTPGC